jgi:hypothetical protein
MKYIIRTKQDGINQVQILEPVAKNKYNLVWEFELKKDDEPIVLAQFYSDDCFVVINWDAWLRAYKVSTQELIFEKKYNGHISTAAQINQDNTLLYLSTEIDDTKPSLIILSLADFTEKKTFEIENKKVSIRKERFHLLSNRKAAYYFDFEKIDGTWEHGFYLLDGQTGKSETFYLDYPHWNEFLEENLCPVLSPRHNIGVMTCWDKIEVKENENGEIVFPYKIMLFNLSDFKIEKTLTIYDVYKNHLSNYESEHDSKAEILKINDIDDDDFREGFIEYTEILQSFYFCNEAKNLWASFSGGILSKVDLQSGAFTLYGMNSCAGRFNEKGILNDLYFYGKIKAIEGTEIIIEEDAKEYSAKLPLKAGYSSSNIVLFDLIPVNEEINIASELEEARKDFSYTIVSVNNIENDADILHALDQIIILTKDIEKIKAGHYLKFRIKDANNILEEEKFFNKAVSISKAEKKILDILANFISCPSAGSLYYDDETTALAFATLCLLKKDTKHIKTAIKYLSVIDFEHDVFCRKSIIPELLKHHKKYGKSIKNQLGKLNEGYWLEDYNNLSSM